MLVLGDWGSQSVCDLLLCHELSRPLGPSGTGGHQNKAGQAAFNCRISQSRGSSLYLGALCTHLLQTPRKLDGRFNPQLVYIYV